MTTKVFQVYYAHRGRDEIAARRIEYRRRKAMETLGRLFFLWVRRMDYNPRHPTGNEWGLLRHDEDDFWKSIDFVRHTMSDYFEGTPVPEAERWAMLRDLGEALCPSSAPPLPGPSLWWRFLQRNTRLNNSTYQEYIFMASEDSLRRTDALLAFF